MHAATVTGARLVVLENLYSYGPTGGQTLTEDLPARATSAKARTRIEMTNELLDAHRRGTLDVTIGRASDFFGPGVTQSALGEQVIRPALTGKRAQVMGNPNLRHSYSYAPDVAKGLIALGTPQAAERGDLAPPHRRDAHHPRVHRRGLQDRRAPDASHRRRPHSARRHRSLQTGAQRAPPHPLPIHRTVGRRRHQVPHHLRRPLHAALVSHRINRPVVPKQPRKGSIMNRKLTAITLIAAALLTNAGFTALGSIFNYPDVLKEPTGEILDRFREHQSSVSIWFAILAASAALFAPIADRNRQAARRPVDETRRTRRHRRRRRPDHRPAADGRCSCPASPATPPAPTPATAANARDHFDTAHTILGNVIGETFGYLLTAAWTLLVVASLGTRFAGRAFAALGTVSAIMIVLGVFSPLDLAVIDTVNFAGYVLWSVWLIWLAVAVLRDARTPTLVQESRDVRSVNEGHPVNAGTRSLPVA